MQALGWTWTGAEQEAFLQGEGFDGEACLTLLGSGGIQGGKSEIAAMQVVSRAPWCGDETTPVWVVGPKYEDTRHEMRRIIRWLRHLGWLDGKPIAPRSPGPWEARLRYTGGLIKTLSVHDGDTEHLAGVSPSLILMVEAGRQPYASYLSCLERTFGTAPLILTGTMENSQRWFADLYLKWQARNPEKGRSFHIPTWTNRSKFPLGLDDPGLQLQRARMTEDAWLARYGGVPAKTPGIVFDTFDHAEHVRPIRLGTQPTLPHGTIYLPPDTPLTVAIDWGYEHYYAVLFCAVVNERVYVLDEIATQWLDDDTMIRRARNHPLWPNVTLLVLDRATKQHHGSSDTTYDRWRAATGLPGHENYVPVLEGIRLVRDKLHVDTRTREPWLYVDPKCQRLAWEMSVGYRRRLDSNGNALTEEPLKIDDDCAKALTYFVWDMFKPTGERRTVGPRSTRVTYLHERIRRGA